LEAEYLVRPLGAERILTRGELLIYLEFIKVIGAKSRDFDADRRRPALLREQNFAVTVLGIQLEKLQFVRVQFLGLEEENWFRERRLRGRVAPSIVYSVSSFRFSSFAWATSVVIKLSACLRKGTSGFGGRGPSYFWAKAAQTTATAKSEIRRSIADLY
jgi:hypothetical protein